MMVVLQISPMDPSLKAGLLDWLQRYRAATGEDRTRLAAQVEAHTALLSSMPQQAWLDVLCANMQTTTPIRTVAKRADLAYAETQALLLAGAKT